MIDTSVLISGLPAPLINEIESYCSSMICRAELVRGLISFTVDPAKRAQAAARRELVRLLDSAPGFWAEFDLGSSDAYGVLTANPASAIRLKDALIAGHAFSLGLALITEDAGFSRFPEVQVCSPALWQG